MVVYPGVIDTDLFSLPDNDVPDLPIPAEPVSVAVDAILGGLAAGAGSGLRARSTSPRSPPTRLRTSRSSSRDGGVPPTEGRRRLTWERRCTTMTAEPDAAGMDGARLERITGHFETNFIEPGKIAGCQIAVMRHGRVAYQRTLGLMDRERARPMADDTIFRIFSMTKPIASVALMQLYERGMFQLTDPVSRYIPAWRTQRSAWCTTTARSTWSSPIAR